MKQQGYLVVDHSASPGLPADIARAAGYDPALCREGKIFEADTLTCCHCKGVVVKNPLRSRDRYLCHRCSGRYVCDGCAYEMSLPHYNHTPFERIIEQAKQAQNGSPMQLLMPGA